MFLFFCSPDPAPPEKFLISFRSVPARNYDFLTASWKGDEGGEEEIRSKRLDCCSSKKKKRFVPGEQETGGGGPHFSRLFLAIEEVLSRNLTRKKKKRNLAMIEVAVAAATKRAEGEGEEGGVSSGTVVN